MYNDLLNQLIINKIQGHRTFISINIASDFIIAFIIIFKNKLSCTRNDKINTGKMITAVQVIHELRQPTFYVKLVHLNSVFLKQLIHHFKAKTLFLHFRYSEVF